MEELKNNITTALSVVLIGGVMLAVFLFNNHQDNQRRQALEEQDQYLRSSFIKGCTGSTTNDDPTKSMMCGCYYDELRKDYSMDDLSKIVQDTTSPKARELANKYIAICQNKNLFN